MSHKWDWTPDMKERDLTLWAVDLDQQTWECVGFTGMQPTVPLSGRDMMLEYDAVANAGSWVGYIPAEDPPTAIKIAQGDLIGLMSWACEHLDEVEFAALGI